MDRVLFVTGAGMSADSGLPTYRGIGGLYNSGRTEDGFAIEDAISGDMLETRPAMSWKYLAQIEESCRGADCNDGHLAIRDFERHVGEVWVLTQNIDGFHTRAGSSNIIEIHGDLHHLECTRCGDKQTVKDYSHLPYLKSGEKEEGVFPTCTKCEGLVRPQVVLFGEMLYMDRISKLQAQLGKGFDAVFSVGTTSIFPYIVAPVTMAANAGKLTVEINPGDTDVSDIVDFKIKSGAAKVLRAIVDRMDKKSK
mmetsp:Transcript_36584/g.85880  ORF Transcript_36584/g.85880 Transcript_36584/m.85880 type:complete len:252 (-) Transcript_36584:33-788(-)